MADNEVKIHIPSGWFSLLLSELDRNKSMISKLLLMIPITMITTVKYSDEWEQEMSV